jgi:hypothetical protein
VEILKTKEKVDTSRPFLLSIERVPSRALAAERVRVVDQSKLIAGLIGNAQKGYADVL